jgi:hypothetical protein
MVMDKQKVAAELLKVADLLTAGSGHAEAAKAIRTVLKKKFPLVKFGVRAKSFAGGNSVDIDWVDGPTTAQVDAVGKAYQYGSFDGMQDLYEYTNVNKELPQVKYVMTSRHRSPKVEKEIIEQTVKDYGIVNVDDHKEVKDKLGMYLDIWVHRVFSQKEYR